MSDNISVQMQIAMAEACTPVKAVDGIEAKFRAAAHVTRGHWLCTNQDEQFRAAVGAVMVDYGPNTPEFERLAVEMKSIQTLNAIFTAAQSGPSVNITDDLPEGEPIGLLNIWQESR